MYGYTPKEKQLTLPRQLNYAVPFNDALFFFFFFYSGSLISEGSLIFLRGQSAKRQVFLIICLFGNVQPFMFLKNSLLDVEFWVDNLCPLACPALCLCGF